MSGRFREERIHFINGVIVSNGIEIIRKDWYADVELARLEGNFAKAKQIEEGDNRNERAIIQKIIINDDLNRKYCFGKRSVENTALEQLSNRLSINRSSIEFGSLKLEGTFAREDRIQVINGFIVGNRSSCNLRIYHQRGSSMCAVEFNQRGLITTIKNCE